MASPARSRAGFLAPILSLIVLGATRHPESAADSRPNPDASPQELAEFVIAVIRDNWAKLPPLEMSAVQIYRTCPTADFEVLIGPSDADFEYHFGRTGMGMVITGGRSTHDVGMFKTGRLYPFRHRYFLGSIREWSVDVFAPDGQFKRSIVRSSDGAESQRWNNHGDLPPGEHSECPAADPRQAGADRMYDSLEMMVSPVFCVSAGWSTHQDANDVLELRFQASDRPLTIVECRQDTGWLPERVIRLGADGAPSSVTVVSYQPVQSGQIARTIVHRNYPPGAEKANGSGWNRSLETEYTIVREGVFDAGVFDAGVFSDRKEPVSIAPLTIAQSALPAAAEAPIADAQERVAAVWTPLYIGAILCLVVAILAVRRRRRRPAAPHGPSVGASRGPRFRPWRFGLRTLLLLVTALAIGMGVLANRAHRVRRLMATVRDVGGNAWYLHEIDADGNPIPNPVPPGPDWLR